MRAVEACEGLADTDTVRCMLANGLERAGEVFALYRAEQAIERAYLRKAHQIAARGDARSLLAAAHILPFAEASAWSNGTTLERRPKAIEWLVRAQRSGRDDPLVQWGVMAFRDFGAEPVATSREARAAAIERLLALDPDNAAVHLLSVQSASSAQQSPAMPSNASLEASAFQRLAARPRYFNHAPGVATLILDALRDMPTEPAFRAAALLSDRDHATATHCASDADILLSSHLMIATGAANATSPAFFAGMPCKEEAMASDDRLRRNCLAFSRRLHATATTIFERSMGAGIARRAASSAAERAHWQNQCRRQRWQVEQYARAMRAIDPYLYRRILAQGWRSGDEVSGMETVLDEAGIPLEPPANWTFPGEPSR